jgi:hypothetical protein
MTQSALDQLLARARGPMGPEIELDFGAESGPLAELGQLITRMNGFFAFNAGIQVFRVGETGFGPDMLSWNTGEMWKDTYGGLADDLFCFGQDIFGVQFAVLGQDQVVRFNPETTATTLIGSSLDDWAQGLFLTLTSTVPTPSPTPSRRRTARWSRTSDWSRCSSSHWAAAMTSTTWRSTTLPTPCRSAGRSRRRSTPRRTVTIHLNAE